MSSYLICSDSAIATWAGNLLTYHLLTPRTAVHFAMAGQQINRWALTGHLFLLLQTGPCDDIFS